MGEVAGMRVHLDRAEMRWKGRKKRLKSNTTSTLSVTHRSEHGGIKHQAIADQFQLKWFSLLQFISFHPSRPIYFLSFTLVSSFPPFRRHFSLCHSLLEFLSSFNCFISHVSFSFFPIQVLLIAELSSDVIKKNIYTYKIKKGNKTSSALWTFPIVIIKLNGAVKKRIKSFGIRLIMALKRKIASEPDSHFDSLIFFRGILRSVGDWNASLCTDRITLSPDSSININFSFWFVCLIKMKFHKDNHTGCTVQWVACRFCNQIEWFGYR